MVLLLECTWSCWNTNGFAFYRDGKRKARYTDVHEFLNQITGSRLRLFVIVSHYLLNPLENRHHQERWLCLVQTLITSVPRHSVVISNWSVWEDGQLHGCCVCSIINNAEQNQVFRSTVRNTITRSIFRHVWRYWNFEGNFSHCIHFYVSYFDEADSCYHRLSVSIWTTSKCHDGMKALYTSPIPPKVDGVPDNTYCFDFCTKAFSKSSSLYGWPPSDQAVKLNHLTSF